MAGKELPQNQKSSMLAWLVWGLAAAYYFCDYSARVSPGVMSHQLQLEFSVTAAGLGALSSYFYYPYVMMQIPVGLIVDRYSIRWILTIMAIITAIGCAVFGLADTIMMASFGRMLIGLSAAFAFVSALRLAATWFPPAKLGLLAGMTQALGMLGASVGEAPVSLLVAAIGWRRTMLVLAFFFIVLASLMYRFIQDAPSNKKLSSHAHANSIDVFTSLKRVLSFRQTWANAFYAGLLFAPTAVIGEFWGPAYLQFGRGLGEHSAAFANGLIFIGWGIGGPITGWFSDKIGLRKPLMIFSAVAGLAIMLVIVFCPNLSALEIYLLFFAFGLTNTGVAIAYAVATEIHNKNVVGTSIAFTNMTSIFIGAVFQPIVGKLIDLHAGESAHDIAMLSISDFRSALWLLPLSSLCALVLSLFVKETYCTPVKDSA